MCEIDLSNISAMPVVQRMQLHPLSYEVVLDKMRQALMQLFRYAV